MRHRAPAFARPKIRRLRRPRSACVTRRPRRASPAQNPHLASGFEKCGLGEPQAPESVRACRGPESCRRLTRPASGSRARAPSRRAGRPSPEARHPAHISRNARRSALSRSLCAPVTLRAPLDVECGVSCTTGVEARKPLGDLMVVFPAETVSRQVRRSDHRHTSEIAETQEYEFTSALALPILNTLERASHALERVKSSCVDKLRSQSRIYPSQNLQGKVFGTPAHISGNFLLPLIDVAAAEHQGISAIYAIQRDAGLLENVIQPSSKGGNSPEPFEAFGPTLRPKRVPIMLQNLARITWILGHHQRPINWWPTEDAKSGTSDQRNTFGPFGRLRADATVQAQNAVFDAVHSQLTCLAAPRWSLAGDHASGFRITRPRMWPARRSARAWGAASRGRRSRGIGGILPAWPRAITSCSSVSVPT